MSKDTGGPAFPMPSTIIEQTVSLIDASKASEDVKGRAADELGKKACGMTLRDYFAAKVLAGIWSNDEALSRVHQRDETSKNIAAICYEMADAMLAERNKE